jgi:hypothetical protein
MPDTALHKKETKEKMKTKKEIRKERENKLRALVRKRTIPTEPPPLIDEVSAKRRKKS